MSREVLARNGHMSLQEIAEHEGISVKTADAGAWERVGPQPEGKC